MGVRMVCYQVELTGITAETDADLEQIRSRIQLAVAFDFQDAKVYLDWFDGSIEHRGKCAKES